MPVERNIRDILASGQTDLLEADMSRRLDMLVRQGLMSTGKLPILKRGLEKLQMGKVGTPQERDAVNTLLNSMMYIVLGDDTVFQRARQHTQKNRYQTEESEINSADESDDVELNEWETFLLDIETLEEKNVPTNPKLWSKYKSQAKSKFDVYPSAYANGWAAKMYKKAGGSWKTVSEEVDTGQYDARKKPQSSEKEKQAVFDKHRERMKKLKKEEVELDEKLETERIKHPVGKRPPGIGWTLKQAGEQTGKDHSVWERKFKRVKPTNEETELDEKIEDMDMGEVIKDFQKSDAPQFKGKSKEKRREMAIAAKLSKEETEEETTVNTNNPFAAAKKAKLDEYRTKNPAADAEDSRQRAKKAAERLSRKVAKTEKETDPGIKEEVEIEEGMTAKDIKMGVGIARDKRYAGGNMTGASKAMEKVKKGLSDHPRVRKELQKQNEESQEDSVDEIAEMSYKEKFQAMLKKTGKSLASMSDEEKKKFFNSVDDAHKAKNENYTMKNSYAKSGKMSKDKESHDTGGFRISNKDAAAAKDRLKAKKGISEVAIAGINAPSQGGTRKELLDKLRKNPKDTKLANSAWKAGATSKEIKGAIANEEIEESAANRAFAQAKRDYDADDKKGLAPTKKDSKPAKVSDASNAKEIEHIVPQMRKAITVGKEVQFQDGKTHKISKGHAAKFLNKYMNSKPADKHKMQTSAHKSHDHFMKHV